MGDVGWVVRPPPINKEKAAPVDTGAAFFIW